MTTTTAKNWQYDDRSWLTSNEPLAATTFPTLNYTRLSESSLLRQRFEAVGGKHPKFVFFGETGKGKSTLIRAIIKDLFGVETPLPRSDSRTTLCPFEISVVPGAEFSAKIRVEADTDYQKIKGIINHVSSSPTEKTEEAKACAWILHRLNGTEVPETLTTAFTARFAQHSDDMLNLVRQYEQPWEHNVLTLEDFEGPVVDDLLNDINSVKHPRTPWPKIVRIIITVSREAFNAKLNGLNGISFVDSRGLGSSDVDGNQVLIPQQELVTANSVVILVDSYQHVSYAPSQLIPQFIQKCPGVKCRYALLLSAQRYTNQRSAKNELFRRPADALKDRAETRSQSLQHALSIQYLPPTVACDPENPANKVFLQPQATNWQDWLVSCWTNMCNSYAEMAMVQYELNVTVDLHPLRTAITNLPNSVIDDWINSFLSTLCNYYPSSINATMTRYGGWIDLKLDFSNALSSALLDQLFGPNKVQLPNPALEGILHQQLFVSVAAAVNDAWPSIATVATYERSRREYGLGNGYRQRVAGIWRESLNNNSQIMQQAITASLNDFFNAVTAFTIEEKFNNLTM
jgi:GTPase SAR1 family protein